jgi:hypothetical protein
VVVAVVVAMLVVAHRPAVAQRLAWRPLLALGWAAAVVWTLALALVDGWRDGVVARLTAGWCVRREQGTDHGGEHTAGQGRAHRFPAFGKGRDRES